MVVGIRSRPPWFALCQAVGEVLVLLLLPTPSPPPGLPTPKYMLKQQQQVLESVVNQTQPVIVTAVQAGSRSLEIPSAAHFLGTQ